MNDLWNEIELKRRELSDQIAVLREYGKKKAEYEREYKIAYRLEVFRLHEEKVAWTAAISLAHGDTEFFEVAKKRYNRDLADTLYQATQEGINGIKLSIRILESQLSREYGAVR